MIRPILATASMLIPALVVATFTEAQIRSVTVKASGRDSIRAMSPVAIPFWTRHPNPPIKSILTSLAARSRVLAMETMPSEEKGAPTTPMGLMAMRLLTMGIPYLSPKPSHTSTRLAANEVIRLYILSSKRCRSSETQSKRLIPRVTVRTSRCSFLTISMVDRTSLSVSMKFPF